MIYGYRVEAGKGVICEEEADRIRALVRAYLGGATVRAAGDAAGIARSLTFLRRILSNPVYLGDDYYPAILTRRTWNKVQRETAKRSHKATITPLPPVPVYTNFITDEEFRRLFPTADLEKASEGNPSGTTIGSIFQDISENQAMPGLEGLTAAEAAEAIYRTVKNLKTPAQDAISQPKPRHSQ